MRLPTHRPRPVARLGATGLVILLALVCFDPAMGRTDAEKTDAIGEEFPLSSDLRIRAIRGREIALEVRAAADDDYASIARRIAGAESLAAEISAVNGGRPLFADRWVRVPLALLSDDYRSLVLLNLFPQDRREDRDWIHVARAGVVATYDEGLWQVAEWFTGDGANFDELMQLNGLTSPELRRGQRLRIPASLLHPALRVRLASDDASLEYDADERGPFAAYRLKAGEALYSAVIVRFTGRTGAEDVTALADELRRRSDIRDPRDIPVGYRIKIPLAMLEPAYLPEGHPRRLEAEAEQVALAQELARKPVAGTRGGLEGVIVVLDPGHGGRDLGTASNGVWEHDYVYDVACRLKQQLETRTAAQVLMTLVDRETGCTPSQGNKLKANLQGTIQTHPPFLAREEGQAKIGVNLRWYLANSIYREAQRRRTEADRVVFLSLHADSRHPSLRGLMVYVPGAGYRTATYGHSGATYRKYEEVREKTLVRFSKKQRVRSEAVSRKLASSIVESFRDHGLPIQPHQPVRNRIIRGRSRFVPAVLRGNMVPNKVLVEMVNLSNKTDAKLLGSARQRQRLADALYAGLFGYFGENPPDSRASAGTTGPAAAR